MVDPHYPIGVMPLARQTNAHMLRAALVLTSLLVWVPAQAHFSLLFSGATGQPASWQEGAFTVTGNWTPDGGVTIHPGQLETGSWLDRKSVV